MIVSVKIGMPAVKELLEASLPSATVAYMKQIIACSPGVEAFHHFASRRNGNMMFADFHIKVRPDITVEEGHDIATDVEKRLKQQFGGDMIVNIHVEPYHGQKTDKNKMCE